MRLIDADELILHLNDYALTESPNDNETTEERRMSEMVYRVIHNCIKAVEEQPTAYDPEAVVAELEEQKVRYKNIRNNTHCIITETSECDSCRADHYLDARLNCVDRAISIVRKGGV